jgi:hypothetical protein
MNTLLVRQFVDLDFQRAQVDPGMKTKAQLDPGGLTMAQIDPLLTKAQVDPGGLTMAQIDDGPLIAGSI